MRAQRSMARSMNALLAIADRVGTDRFLEVEDEARTDRFDDGRRAALLAVLEVPEVDVLGGVHIGDGSPARHARHPVAEQLASRHEDPRRPGRR